MLHDDCIINITLYFPLSSVRFFCTTIKIFSRVVINGERFWQLKFIQECDSVEHGNIWKILYINHMIDIWSFCSNYYRQLGIKHRNYTNIPTKFNNIKAKAVSTRLYHKLIIDINGWSFGNKTSRQLGFGDKINRLKPTIISNFKYKS